MHSLATLAPPPARPGALIAKLNEYSAERLEAFRHESEAFLRLLRLAVNEAEGLAYSTSYAHLLLPALIEEKIHYVRRWANHQHGISPGLHPSPAATSPVK